ncbi:MAG: TrkH family potassium uptake protein [Rikenellaceae bacterium]|nr:TrkH family potassium uptake protein [Rikenellaceae bacterium]
MLFAALFMAVSAVVSFLNGMDSSFYPLVLSSLITALMGAFPMLFVPRIEQISNKEGFCIVVGSWIMACVVGMFPYLMWGGEFSLVNAWFESVSGFTTTGATILHNVEALPKGLMFWRSCTAWLGGVGVVMFALVVLPSLGKTKMTLSNVELSSLAKDNYRYRTQQIVRILMVVYMGLTIITTLLLKVAGMGWFDALNHAMSACATCGFGTKNLSIAFYDNPYIELVLIGAMILAGIHFGLIYATIVGKPKNIFRSEVTRTYFAVIAVGSLLVAISLYFGHVYPDLLSSLRHASFQFVSLLTTTGYATADTNTWTTLAILLLIFASVVCGCAGSTSGGLKIDRMLLFAKMFKARMRRQQHPNAVIRLKVDGVIQEEELLTTVVTFMVTYLALLFVGAVVNALFGLDMMTAVSSAIACLGNVGPGFGEVGSMANYAELPVVLKLQDAFLMLMGRLEIFGFIQLFFLKWWR